MALYGASSFNSNEFEEDLSFMVPWKRARINVLKRLVEIPEISSKLSLFDSFVVYVFNCCPLRSDIQNSTIYVVVDDIINVEEKICTSRRSQFPMLSVHVVAESGLLLLALHIRQLSFRTGILLDIMHIIRRWFFKQYAIRNSPISRAVHYFPQWTGNVWYKISSDSNCSLLMQMRPMVKLFCWVKKGPLLKGAWLRTWSLPWHTWM